jgi:hypothetical protein
MRFSDARARQQRNDRLRHHRHVNNDAIAFLNSLPGEHAGQSCYLIEQLAIRQRSNDSCHGTVLDERRLIRAPAFEVAVERVVACTDQSAEKHL